MTKENKETKLKKSSKKSLKTMQKNRSRHIVREKVRVVKYGTKGFGRNIWLSMAAMVVMAVTLIILFATIVASMVLATAAEAMKEKIDITVYFKSETSAENLEELSGIMMAEPNVKEVEVLTAEEMYEKMLEEQDGEDAIMEVLDDELTKSIVGEMPAAMRVRVYNVTDLDGIKSIVETDKMFAAFTHAEKAPTYDEEATKIETIINYARIVRVGGIVLAGVFLAVSILIIFSTIRMAIFSRREEIYMMKLVGADRSFIRGPFLVEAEICGIVAGLIAGVVSSLGFNFLAPKLNSGEINIDPIINVMCSSQVLLVYSAFIIVGMIIGGVSARLAISKYINKA